MNTLFNYIPRLAWVLSGKNPLHFVRTISRLYIFAIDRNYLKSKRTTEYYIKGFYNGIVLDFYLQEPIDIAVLVEVFVFKEYSWKLDQDPKVIVDLGAHFGDTALYYHAVYPDAQIIAVEPSPENYARLVRHTKHIPNITTVQAAVGVTDGMMQLHLSNSSLGHSVVQRTSEDKQVAVRQISLPTLYDEHNITKADLLKFDIEGAEFELLASLDIEKIAKSYIGELHFDLDKRASIESVNKKFIQFNSELQQLGNRKRFIIKLSLSATS